MSDHSIVQLVYFAIWLPCALLSIKNTAKYRPMEIGNKVLMFVVLGFVPFIFMPAVNAYWRRKNVVEYWRRLGYVGK